MKAQVVDEGGETRAAVTVIPWRWLRYCALAVSALVVVIGVLSVIANLWMIAATRSAIYSDVERIPPNAVGLLLGTSPYTISGHDNPYFRGRINAAVRLYQAGKVQHLLVSGANPSRYYNEPQAMFEALRAAGVPAAAITLDYAGFRTLDSVIRARRVFGQQTLTIISQRYHDYRALFVAWCHGVDAIAFAAPEVAVSRSLDTRVREFLARVRAVLDVYVLHAQPRYLGTRVEMDVNTGIHDSDDDAGEPLRGIVL